MAIILDRADSRGDSDIGWLASKHTFSFASYRNPERMGFGALRVINDDIVQASMGFATHPHENMEIISIPLTGSLRHEDNVGNKHVISVGEVQVMSAGTGITHSEYNNSETDEVNFLQIWVLPKEQNIEPRYDQKEITTEVSNNAFQLIVAPLEGHAGNNNVVQMNQDAYFSIIQMEENKTLPYNKYDSNNGVYFFVIEGGVIIASHALDKRDGIGVWDEDVLMIESKTTSTVLCMEVPM